MGLTNRLASLHVAKLDIPQRAHYLVIVDRKGRLEVKEFPKNRRELAALFHMESERPETNVVMIGASRPE